MMNKLLVTGSNGLIGSAIRNIHKENANTLFLTREVVDLTQYEKTKTIFEKFQPTQVIHLAAVVGGLGSNSIHSGEYFRHNILINVNVLESARIVGVNKLISFMSTCIFPDKINYPLNEKDLHNGPPHPSNFGYAYAKRMLEVQSAAYRKEWGCNYITVIPTNVYGPHDNFSLENGHVVSTLIHKCFLAKQNNTDLVVWGTGAPLREFVYSEDIARLTLWALDNYNEETPIIFTSGIEYTIKELVETIIKTMKFKGKVIFDKTKPDGQFRKPSDPTKLRSYLPEFKFLSLQEGIAMTVEWFLNNYPNIRK
jgi:GDP-L-fucose synthase